jgi:transposase
MDGDAKELDLYSKLLGLEEFEVVHVEQEPGKKAWRLTVVPRLAVGMCPHCGGLTEETHEGQEREFLDLPLGQCPTKLQVRLWQFHCAACDRFFTPHYPALAEGTHVTGRLLERMVAMIGFSDIRNAARFFGVPEKTLERWYYEFLERKQKNTSAQNQPIRSLGIDELSLKKSTGSSARC